MIYCTLFDSNYLDKALVTIESLFECDSTAKIYVLCMDDRAFEILNDLQINNVSLISLKDFEDEDLKKVKESRSRGEFCWTCTAKLIYYVLSFYKEEICTYIDADLLFLSDPTILIKEMLTNNCTVQVVRHNFPKNREGRRQEKLSGKICVEFNTFCNEKRSIDLLKKWISSCLNECSVDCGGDQMYLNDWDKYDFVNVTKEKGAGLAPWNIQQFEMVDSNFEQLKDRKSKERFKPIFYHFQNVTNKDRYTYSIIPLLSYCKIDKDLIEKIYYPYFRKIEEKKCFFENKYNFLPLIKEYISDNRVSKKEYFKRILRHPFSSTPLIFHRIKLSILNKTRYKKAYIDIRNI